MSCEEMNCPICGKDFEKEKAKEAEIKRLKAVIGDVTEICNEVWICQEFKYVKDEYKFNIEKRNDKLKRIKEAVSKLREGE